MTREVEVDERLTDADVEWASRQLAVVDARAVRAGEAVARARATGRRPRYLDSPPEVDLDWISTVMIR